MYLARTDVLTKGREGLNLPQFQKPRPYAKYGETLFRALDEWTQGVLSINEVADPRKRFHGHSVPEQIILPATNGLPLMIVRSVSRKMQVAESYKPNDDYHETGYLIPRGLVSSSDETSISIAPTERATDFVTLFRRTRGDNYTHYSIGDTSWSKSVQWRGSALPYTQSMVGKLRPQVRAILDHLGYDDSAFEEPGLMTFNDYDKQVCEEFDQ